MISPTISDVKVLQGERDRVVVLEDGGTTARKTFYGSDSEVVDRLARREFDRLQRFAAALVGVDGAACPEPKELIPGSAPSIRMSLAPGSMVSDLLVRPLGDDVLDRLADVIARASLVYVSTFDEPYFDLHFCNMFYDRSINVVTFVDFGFPYPNEELPAGLRRLTPLEVSVGNLIGSSVFESARPRIAHRRLQHRQALLLASLVAHHPAVVASGAVSPAGLLSAARVAYDRPAYRGGWYRRLWYRTAGGVLARPGWTVEAACSPALVLAARRADAAATAVRP